MVSDVGKGAPSEKTSETRPAPEPELEWGERARVLHTLATAARAIELLDGGDIASARALLASLFEDR